MYVCGPTVYNYIHIGNARPVIFFDMLKNYLEFSGYTVKYASNITDVDDKIIAKAIENNVSEKDITNKYEEAYFEDVLRLGSKNQMLFLMQQNILEKWKILFLHLLKKAMLIIMTETFILELINLKAMVYCQIKTRMNLSVV